MRLHDVLYKKFAGDRAAIFHLNQVQSVNVVGNTAIVTMKGNSDNYDFVNTCYAFVKTGIVDSARVYMPAPVGLEASCP